ncbi:MAG: hypothetical protein JO283_19290, partial [Bradyrhizobium sp.]|nr:hypothetical protein [Bradyrhizobium sp.]
MRLRFRRSSVADSGEIARALVIMGVSGSGKSTIGQAVAARLGWPFEDGDS